MCAGTPLSHQSPLVPTTIWSTEGCSWVRLPHKGTCGHSPIWSVPSRVSGVSLPPRGIYGSVSKSTGVLWDSGHQASNPVSMDENAFSVYPEKTRERGRNKREGERKTGRGESRGEGGMKEGKGRAEGRKRDRQRWREVVLLLSDVSKTGKRMRCCCYCFS